MRFVNRACARRAATLVMLSVSGVVGACSDTTQPQRPATLVLDANEAAALNAKFELIAAASQDLQWLTDSANIVIQAGTQVKLIPVTVDGGATSYYAVSLIRNLMTTNAFSTFHLIAFDNPSNPTHFLVLNGYAASGDSHPPTTISGTFGGSDVFAHLITASAGLVNDWQATDGSATLSLGGVSDSPCTLPLPQGVSCLFATLDAQASILAATAGQSVTTRSAAIAPATVPGLLLTYQ
jgi:hypothetical protein